MLKTKRLNNVSRGRINSRKEAIQQLRLKKNLERKFNKNLNTLFRKFVRVQMYLYGEYGIYDQTIAEQSLNEDMFPLLTAHYKRCFKVIFDFDEQQQMANVKADTEATVFGRNIDFERLVEIYFSTRVLYISGMTSRMSRMISTYIERYRNDGLTIRQIASSLVKQFDGMTPYRASLIARTETHNATSYAHNAYYRKVQEDTGQKMVKKWVAVSDARTRSNHALANGQIVDMDEDFIVGGTRMGYAGDPRGGIANTINCRCVIVYGDERDIT